VVRSSLAPRQGRRGQGGRRRRVRTPARENERKNKKNIWDLFIYLFFHFHAIHTHFFIIFLSPFFFLLLTSCNREESCRSSGSASGAAWEEKKTKKRKEKKKKEDGRLRGWVGETKERKKEKKMGDKRGPKDEEKFLFLNYYLSFSNALISKRYQRGNVSESETLLQG
jgi:hypothetical protein